MFTGLVTHVGTVLKVIKAANDLSVVIKATPDFCEKISLGDSIAIDGTCLTVVDFSEDTFTVDVSMETISCTTFSSICEGLKVNLEKCLTLSTPIGGHLMSGHVHGTGVIRSIHQDGRAKIIEIEMPDQLMKYFAPKGTVALNGVSLTVNLVTNKTIKISCIPHTMEKTTLKYKQPGDRMNVEVDVLMLYLDRLLTHDSGDDVRLLDIEVLQRVIGVSRTEH